jgi:drug/metabolite transporter (DMT)-like permease
MNLAPALHFGELAALGTALLWTFSTLTMTAGGKRVGALAGSLYRLILGCVLMMIYGYLLRGRWLPSDASPRTWLLLGISGFFGFFLCDVCCLKSMLLIGPRLAILIQSLTPPMAAVLSWVCIHDALTARQWAAMGITLAGVLWVILEQPNENGQPHALPERWKLGIALAVFAAAMQAVGMVFSKEGLGDYDAVAATLIRGLAALPGYVVAITLTRRWRAMLAAACHVPAMLALSAGAVLGPFAGVALYMVALRHAPTGVVATIIATMPMLILPLSILIYHEKVSPRAIGGAVLAVAGVALLVL